MPEHYTSNTESVWKYCNVCRRNTEHAVYDKRIGPCKEHGAKDKPKKPEPPPNSGELFK